MPLREDAPYRLRDALAGFDARGIKLPTTVTDAVKHWQAIKNRTPADQPPTALHDAVLAGADDDTIARLLLSNLGSTKLRSAYTQAAVSAANGTLGAIMDARDNLHTQLAKLAHKAIGKLETIAQFGSCTLDSLVQEGRNDDARLFADRALIGAELHAAYRLRDDYLLPGGINAARLGHIDATQWRDPTALDGVSAASNVLDRYLSGLRAGGRLWFPTQEQAVEAARPIYDAWQQEAERAAAERRSQGGIVAFG